MKRKLTYEERKRDYLTQCECPKCGCNLYTDKKYIYCVDGISGFVPCTFCMTIDEWNESVRKENQKTSILGKIFNVFK